MKTTSRGFSLIECLLYCAIMTLLAMLVFEFFLKSRMMAHQLTQQTKQIMAVQAAYDFILRDMEQARVDSQFWDSSDAQAVICKVGKTCIGWSLRNKKLYRTVGQYDFAFGYWTSKSAALVAQSISHFSYQTHRNNNTVLAVDIRLEAPAFACDGTACLYNGITL